LELMVLPDANPAGRQCPLLAQSGHPRALNQCLLLGVKRTLLLTSDEARWFAANIAKLLELLRRS